MEQDSTVQRQPGHLIDIELGRLHVSVQPPRERCRENNTVDPTPLVSKFAWCVRAINQPILNLRRVSKEGEDKKGTNPPRDRKDNPRWSNPTPDDTQNLLKDEIDEKPWKYIGYRGYSAFIASENDFFVLRKFSSISARVALMLQDQVAVLEEKLWDLDWKYSRREAVDVNNGTFRDDEEDRVEILEALRAKLVEYNEFILQQKEIKKHPSPLPKDIQSLDNWHWNHEYKATSTEEQEYLAPEHERDLLSVVPKEKTPLRRFLERSRRFRVHWFWKDEKAPEIPSYDENVLTYSSDKKMDRFANIVITCVGMAMLIAPLWVLEPLDSTKQKLRAITAFLVVFLGMIGCATVAKPFEALAGTAAYAAVLMVFMQTSSN